MAPAKQTAQTLMTGAWLRPVVVVQKPCPDRPFLPRS